MGSLLHSAFNVGPVNVLALVLTVSYWIFIFVRTGQNRLLENPKQSVADFNTTSLYYSAFSNDYEDMRSRPTGKYFSKNAQTNSEPGTAQEIILKNMKDCKLQDTTKTETREIFKQLQLKFRDLPFPTLIPGRTLEEKVTIRNCLIKLATNYFEPKEDTSAWTRLKYPFSSDPNLVKIDNIIYKFPDLDDK